VRIALQLFLHHQRHPRRGGAVRGEITVASLCAELDEAKGLAAERGQAAAMVAATMGKAKLTGLIVDKHETKNVTR
jgi:hypothetical protein